MIIKGFYIHVSSVKGQVVEVRSISPKLVSAAEQQAHSGEHSTDLSFKGNLAKRAGDELVTKTKVNMPWFINFMDKLRVLKGETGGIIINALGTGLVAPIFIAYNPLSKADEDTKKYTAMRQPVSAVLAILIQAGLTKPLGDFYDYLSNTGKLGRSVWLNQQKLNSQAYLQRLEKKNKVSGYAAEMQRHQANDAALELQKTGTFAVTDTAKLSEQDAKKVIDKTIERYQEVLDKEITKSTQKAIDKKVDRAKLLINITNEAQIREMCASINKAKTVDEVNKVLENYLKSNNPDIVQIAQEFQRRSISLESVSHRASKTLEKIELFNRNVRKAEFIADISDGFLKKLNAVVEGSDDFNKLVDDIFAMTKDENGKKIMYSEYVEQIAEELKHRETPEARSKYAQKIIERIGALKAAEGDKLQIIEICQRAYYRDVEDELLNQKQILEKMKTTNRPGVSPKDMINEYKVKIKGRELSTFKDRNFVDDTVKTFQKTVEKRFKGFKQISNILIGLFITLPITCHALNWCYPRFMDIFFPNLSKNDKSEAPEEKAKRAEKGGK